MICMTTVSTFNLAASDTMPLICSKLIVPKLGHVPHCCHNAARFRLSSQPFVKVNDFFVAVLGGWWCGFASLLWRKKGR